jgi:hypothetical protein
MEQKNAVDAKEKTKKGKTGLSRFSKTVRNVFSNKSAIKRLKKIQEDKIKSVNSNKNHGTDLVDKTQETDTLFLIPYVPNPIMPKGIKIANEVEHFATNEGSRILATEFGITHGFKSGKVKTVFKELKEKKYLCDLNVMEYAYKNPVAFILGLQDSHHNLFQKNIFFGISGKSSKGHEYIVGLRAVHVKKRNTDEVLFFFVSKEFNDELGLNDHFIYLKK